MSETSIFQRETLAVFVSTKSKPLFLLGRRRRRSNTYRCLFLWYAKAVAELGVDLHQLVHHVSVVVRIAEKVLAVKYSKTLPRNVSQTI